MTSEYSSSHEHDIERERLFELKQRRDAARMALMKESMEQELSDLNRQLGRKSRYRDNGESDYHARRYRSKRATHEFVSALLGRMLGLFSLQPIVGHIIGVIVLIVAFIVAANKLPSSLLLHYGVYLNWIIGITLGIVVIKSASYSLALPALALVIGATSTAVAHHFHGTVFTLEASFYFRMLIVGIIGLIIAALTLE